MVTTLPNPTPRALRRFSTRLSASGLVLLAACTLFAVAVLIFFPRSDVATRRIEAMMKDALESSQSVTARYTDFDAAGADGIGTFVRCDPSPTDLKRLASLLKLYPHRSEWWPGAPHGIRRLEVTLSAKPDLHLMLALPDRIYMREEGGDESHLVHANIEFMREFWTSAGLGHAFNTR